MAGHFETLLAGIVADPAQRIGDLPLLSEAERRQILVEWNGGAPCASPAPPCVLRAVRADRSPAGPPRSR